VKKTCSKCKRELDVSMFHRERKGKDGLRAECKDCVRKKCQDNYVHHRENGTLRYWNFRASTINGHAIERYGITEKVTALELFNLFNNSKGECCYCGEQLTPKSCHVDHKISLSSGGTNNVDNLVISCPRCNLIKSSKSEKQEIDEHEFFLYISKIYNRLKPKYCQDNIG